MDNIFSFGGPNKFIYQKKSKMNQNNRICIVKDHQEYLATDICTFKDCKFTTRWCCSQCLKFGIHYHQQQNNKHIMNRKEIISEVKSKYEIFKKDYDSYIQNQCDLLQNFLTMFYLIEESMRDFKFEIHKQKQNLNFINESFRKCLSFINNDKFEEINDEIFNKLLSYKQNQILQGQFIQPLDDIKQYIENLRSIISDYQQKQIKDNKTNETGHSKQIEVLDNKKNETGHSEQIAVIRRANYVVQVIEKADGSYFCSSISQNEQYLAYGGNQYFLKIYDIQKKKIIKQIIIDNYICVCQFTQDSQLLYVGFKDGYLRAYSVKDNFELQYQRQVHLSDLTNIIIIQNEHLITCSTDRTIIRTDMRANQKIFGLYGHKGGINTIVYDNLHEIIISGSDDHSIKFWDCINQKIIINKEDAHQDGIKQIQYNSHLLSLDFIGIIYNWEIDFQNKQIRPLYSFRDEQNKIYNFYQTQEDQLLLLCNNYMMIERRRTKSILNHNEKGKIDNTHIIEPLFPLDCKQLDNLSYIQIRVKGNIINQGQINSCQLFKFD